MGWKRHSDVDQAEVGDRVRFTYLDGLLEGTVVSQYQHGYDWHFNILEKDVNRLHTDVHIDSRVAEVWREVDNPPDSEYNTTIHAFPHVTRRPT